jgi:hypothetical protein
MKAISYILFSICLLATACKKNSYPDTTTGTGTQQNASTPDTTIPADNPKTNMHVDSLVGTYYGTERHFFLFTKNGDTITFNDSLYASTITVSSVAAHPQVFLITKKCPGFPDETWTKQYFNTTLFQDGPPPPNSGGVAWYFYPVADSAYYWTGGIANGNGNVRQETYTTGSWKK